MKKATVIIASLVILASVSCKEQNEEPQVVEKTETVVIEKENQPEEKDGTSLSIRLNSLLKKVRKKPKYILTLNNK